MFERPHMSLRDQLLLILTGESWVMDTDLADCEICSFERVGLSTSGGSILIRTPDGSEYRLTTERII